MRYIRIRRHRQSLVFYLFASFLILCHKFFYLVPESVFPISEAGLVVGVMAVSYAILIRKRNKYYYAGIALVAILLSFTSAYQARNLNGQPIWLGLRPQRVYIVCWLMYFALSKFLSQGQIQKMSFVALMRGCAYVQLGLYFLQFFVGSGHIFLDVNYNYRYGSLRLYGSYFFADLLYAIALGEQVSKKKLQRRNMIEILVCWIYVFLITKGRMQLFCYLSTAAIAVIIWHGASYKKVVAVILGFMALGFLLTDEMIESLVSAFTQSQSDINVTIRLKARMTYLDAIRRHPLLGGGFVNTQYKAAADMAGVNKNLYFADNGVFGFMYQYGLLGLAWNVVFFVKLASDGLKIARKYGDYSIILFLLFNLFGAATGHWISYYMDTLRVVFLAALVDMYKNRLAREGITNFPSIA